MAVSMKSIIGLVLSLIITGMLLPTGLLYLYTGQYQNVTVAGTTYTFGTVMDPTLVTLMTVILPIVVLITVIIRFVPKSK